MAGTVGIGIQDFAKIIENKCFYVDKTAFIKEWWESRDDVTLITRPRRFGKTLAMSMLEHFFSVEHGGRGDLFEGLDIWKEEKYRSLQGTYPVIFISFADVKETSFLDTRKKICQIITKLYNKYDFLLESGHLNGNEQASYRAVSEEMENYMVSGSLNALSDYLSRYYGRKTIILLDEYDTPMQEAYVHGYWEEMAAFIRSLFNSTFKTNSYLERAVMTGITRVSKESIFSDLNHLEIVTSTSCKYEAAFGFTEREVFAAMDEFGCVEKDREEVRAWYDGFTFGKISDIYNPWSIINYLDKGRVAVYWANTSSNSLVGKLIREGIPKVKVIMEDLLQGKIFHTTIDEQVIFSQLDDNVNAIWSLLLASGYLKVTEHWLNQESGEEEYFLALTNREVHIMFNRLIKGWFAESASAEDYNDFVKALLLGDVEAMNDYMNRVALATFSSFDVGRKPSEKAKPERFYHGFVLGLMVELGDRYVLTSNRESGFGRYDIVLEPRGRGGSGTRADVMGKAARDVDAIIIEFKVHNPKREKTLEETVAVALKQIEERQYGAALLEKGIPAGRIRKYGFAFCGKEILIGSAH